MRPGGSWNRLNGLVISDNFGSHTILGDVPIAAGDAVLLAVSDDSLVNGGLVGVDYVYPYSTGASGLALAKVPIKQVGAKVGKTSRGQMSIKLAETGANGQ